MKQDAGMPREQQVGQTLRLLEHVVWEDQGLRKLLADEGLRPCDVCVTYRVAMTDSAAAIIEYVDTARTLRDIRRTYGDLKGFLLDRNGADYTKRALPRLAVTAAISAVLAFVAGLGDRHDENMMVTADGRLLHVDYGYSLGREPFDLLLINLAVEGKRPVMTMPYEELERTLGAELMTRLFWSLVRGAYLAIRRQTGILLELTYAAALREPYQGARASQAAVQRALSTTQAFVAERCATAMPERCATRFVESLLRYCAGHQRGPQLRDHFRSRRKTIELSQRTQQVIRAAAATATSVGHVAGSAFEAAPKLMGPRGAPHVAVAVKDVAQAATGIAAGLFGGARELFGGLASDRAEAADTALRPFGEGSPRHGGDATDSDLETCRGSSGED